MTSIVFLTSSFPYEGGEQFIEEEIKYWNDTRFKNVYILPHSKRGELRSLPSNIKLLTSERKVANYLFVAKALTNPIFFKEISFIIRKTNLKNALQNCFYALKTTAQTIKAKEYIESSIKDINDDIVIYSYWNSIYAYAATILKDKKLVSQVFSRAHRFDLYEYEQPHNYMPLKRQFTHKFNKVFLLSEDALQYFQSTYGSPSKNLAVSPLGVKMPSSCNSQKLEKNTIQILSLSNCYPVKQIDKILYALKEYAQLNSHIKINWNHIGDGPLKKDLVQKSYLIMKELKNLNINFLGSYTNTQVHQHLASTYYDFIINSSSSEGIPVSIMEAMSYGIPAIATNVGGTANLVNNDNGVLLPAKFTNQDVIRAISLMIKETKSTEKRLISKKYISEYFNAHKNYSGFIKSLESLSIRR